MIFSSLLATVYAQVVAQYPIETEADRMPKIRTGGDCLIAGGKVFTITGKVLENTDVLVRNGIIVKIGQSLERPANLTVIDARGKCVLPGIVDAHSHRGETESNEYTASAVPEVRIHDVLDPEQDGLWGALANGITTGMLLHGSSNAIGGESVVVKHRWKKKPLDMVFQGAPRMVKFALGENVSEKLDPNGTRFPISRAGVESVYRRAFTDAKAYIHQWDAYQNDKSLPRPRKDLRLEALADILRGKIWVQCHSYRQDEILMMVRLSQEFGFKIGSMQHALEAYKIAPELAEAHVPASMFSDAWAYKVEVYDAIPMGVSLCVRAGVLSSVNTDTFGGMPPLNLDVAKTMRYGVSEAEALKLFTINPAKQLGVDKFVGSIEVGKQADFSIWSGHPLSVYSRCAVTMIDGEVVFQRRDAFHVDSSSTTKSTVRATQLTADMATALPDKRTYAIMGGTVHPVNGGDIERGVVVFVDGKITAVGGPETKIPDDAYRLNASGLHVYPGLIDGGSDIGNNEVQSVPSLKDDQENGPFQPDLRFLTSLNPESSRIPIARCGGVTSALTRPTGNGLVMGLGAVIDLFGSTREQMVVKDRSHLYIRFPESVSDASKATLPSNVLDEQQKAVDASRQSLKEYFALAKRYADMRGSVETDAKLEAMVDFVEGKSTVIVQANGEDTIKEVLKWAKEIGLKVIISGGAESWKVSKELKDQGVPVLYSAPTTSCPGENRPFGDLDPYDANLAAPSLLAKAGVLFGLQVGDSCYTMNLPWSAGMLCANGLSPRDALRAVTLSTAKILGVEDWLGSLEAGKSANVIVTDGDVLEITTQLRYEFVRGRPVTLKSKFTDLYRKYEKRLAKS